MKILFKNTTTYTDDAYFEFLRFHNDKFAMKYTLFNILIIFILLSAIVLCVDGDSMSLAILFCTILSYFIFLRYIKPFIVVRNEFESEKISKKEAFTFTFFDDNFSVDGNFEDKKIVNKYPYIYKAFETTNFFYLYINSKNSYIINKNNFIDSNSDEFSNFLKSKIGNKFKKNVIT